jgi:hypothetical protein
MPRWWQQVWVGEQFLQFCVKRLFPHGFARGANTFNMKPRSHAGAALLAMEHM